MTRAALCRTLFVALAVLLTATPGVVRGQRDLDAPDTAAIDAFVEAQMDRHQIVGLALAITHGDEVVHVQGYGTAGEGRPVTAATPFYIGSVSKSVTALATMQLVDAGQIELDRPVRDYLPWFAVADPDASARITVRHLLNQTSGLSRAGYVDAVRDPDATMEEAVRALQSAAPVAPPGTEFHYFNPNYTTLGLLIEAVTGRPYGEYMAEHVFAPLQMDRTFTSRQAAEQAGLARGYNVLFGFPIARRQPHLAYDLPAGFLISTAEDMAHYLIGQTTGSYAGRRIVSPAGLDALHQPPTGVGGTYAMGWDVGVRAGERIIRHDGTLETFYASALLLPDDDYGVALLVNQVSYPHMLFAYEEIVQGIVDRLAGRDPGTGIATSAVYLVLLAVVLATLALQIRSIARFGRWRARVAARPRTGVLLGTLWKLAFGFSILLILPWLLIQNAGLAATRAMLVHYLPGVTLWLGLMAALSLAEGLLRGWHLVRVARNK